MLRINASPFSMDIQESLRFTPPFLMDFTSVPKSSMPASMLSMMKYSCLTMRFSAMVLVFI